MTWKIESFKEIGGNKDEEFAQVLAPAINHERSLSSLQLAHRADSMPVLISRDLAGVAGMRSRFRTRLRVSRLHPLFAWRV